MRATTTRRITLALIAALAAFLYLLILADYLPTTPMERWPSASRTACIRAYMNSGVPYETAATRCSDDSPLPAVTPNPCYASALLRYGDEAAAVAYCHLTVN